LEALGFGERTRGVVNQLILMSDKTKALRQNLEGAAGATGKAAETMVTPMEAAIKKLTDSFSKFSGVVEGLADSVGTLASVINSVGEATGVGGDIGQKAIGWSIGIAVLVPVVRSVASGFTFLADAASKAASAVGSAASGIGATIAVPLSAAAWSVDTLYASLTKLKGATEAMKAKDAWWAFWSQAPAFQAEPIEELIEGPGEGTKEYWDRMLPAYKALAGATETLVQLEKDRAEYEQKRVDLVNSCNEALNKQNTTLEEYRSIQAQITELQNQGLMSMEQGAEALEKAYRNLGAYRELQERIAEEQARLEVLQAGGTEQEAERAVTLRRAAAMGLYSEDVSKLFELQDEEAKLIEQRRALEDDKRKALSIEESVMTDQERAYWQLMEVERLWEQGLISAETMRRAAEQAKGVGRGEYRLAGAVQWGTTEAYSAVVRAWAERQGADKDANERTAKATEKLLETIERMEGQLAGKV